MSTPTKQDAPKQTKETKVVPTTPATEESDEWQYVHKDEKALKDYMAGANTNKKVAFRGYKIAIVKPIPSGEHYVMSYSGREAMGQLMASMGIEADAIDGPARVVSVAASVDNDPTLSDETRAAIKRLLANAK